MSLQINTENQVTSTSSGNGLTPTMSHAPRRRHDSDNEQPTE